MTKPDHPSQRGPVCPTHRTAYTDWCVRCVEDKLAALPAYQRKAVFAVITAQHDAPKRS